MFDGPGSAAVADPREAVIEDALRRYDPRDPDPHIALTLDTALPVDPLA